MKAKHYCKASESTPGLNFSFNNALTINTNTYPEQKITVDSKGFGTPQNPHVKTLTITAMQ